MNFIGLSGIVWELFMNWGILLGRRQSLKFRLLNLVWEKYLSYFRIL